MFLESKASSKQCNRKILPLLFHAHCIAHKYLDLYIFHPAGKKGLALYSRWKSHFSFPRQIDNRITSQSNFESWTSILPKLYLIKLLHACQGYFQAVWLKIPLTLKKFSCLFILEPLFISSVSDILLVKYILTCTHYHTSFEYLRTHVISKCWWCNKKKIP